MCRSLDEGGRRCQYELGAAALAAHNGRRRTARIRARLTRAGIAASAGSELPALYWWDGGSGDRLAASRMRAVRDPRGVLWKPTGGVWTAPALDSSTATTTPNLREGIHTTWTGWSAEPGEAGAGHLTRVVPSARTVVVRLRTEADVAAACRAWPRTVRTPTGAVEGFSFEAMRRAGVDAVHVHEGPVTGTESLLYGWDADNVLWLNPTAIRPGQRSALAWSA